LLLYSHSANSGANAPSPPAAQLDLRSLAAFCRTVRFRPGDVLRLRGQHYTDMYLVADGRVDVDFGPGPVAPKGVGPGSPVGEIGFLRGCAATGTATAGTPVTALALDDATLAAIEQEQPALAAQFLQTLADIAEERTSYNLTFTGPAVSAPARAIEVLLCRDADLLLAARRLRYEVYCEELGRNSPYADHEARTLADALDNAGHVFVALEAGEVIGTGRINLASEGPLGVLEALYGMKRSPHHPRATAICTKLVVRKAKRRSPAALKLIGASARFCVSNGIKELYIDCIPPLLSYYRAIGFKAIGNRFLHRENGPSQPMVVDVTKHGPRLSREFGALQYLRLYAVAKAIRWIDRLCGNETSLQAEAAST
jgi:predicted GNAT family N-acyltransferase